MRDRSEEITTQFEPLSCHTIVYRALMKKRWIDEGTGEILADAFFLRKDRGEIGVSVNPAITCSPQDCANRFKRCNSVASLHVGKIRDLGLDVIQNTHNHAHITGLPYPEDNEAEWERLADLLAKQSRIIRI
jgi:hypothetical protein